MDSVQIIYPILPIVALHFYAHIHLSFSTYRAIKSREVSHLYFQVYEGGAPGYLKAARDHYKNFTEQPILFYLLCILLFVTDSVIALDIYLSWGYTLFKVIHSFIRFTSNYVPHRAKIFYICYFILAGGWIRFVFSLF